MKIDVEELSTVKRGVTVTIPAADVDKTLDQIYGGLKNKVKLKGFRPGKAPRQVLERYYGAQASAEAAEKIIGQAYPDALEQSNLDPVARPDFDFEPPQPGQDFSFTVTLDVRPEFELDPASYKGFELKEPKLEMTDEEMDKRLDALRERQAVLLPMEEDRPAGTGDVVVVNYQSFIGEEPVEGGEAENVEIELGKGQTQEEIEVALVKTKPGDIVEANVEYGQDVSNPQLQGQTVRFKLMVKAIKTKALPELDDDFARTVNPEFDTLESLKDRIKSEMEEVYEEQRETAVRNQILDNIRGLVEFELPESLVKSEIEDMIESFKTRMRRSGMDPDAAGLDEEKMAAEFKEPAEKKVTAGIILGRITELENLEVAEEDEQGEFKRVSERLGQPEEVIREMYIKNNMMPSLRARLLEEKTLQAIKADANIIQVDPAELAQETQKSAGESDGE